MKKIIIALLILAFQLCPAFTQANSVSASPPKVFLRNGEVWIRSSSSLNKKAPRSSSTDRQLTHDHRSKLTPQISPDGKLILIAFRNTRDAEDKLANDVEIIDPRGRPVINRKYDSDGIISSVGWLTPKRFYLRFTVTPSFINYQVIKLPKGEVTSDFFGTGFVWDKSKKHVAYQGSLPQNIPAALAISEVYVDRYQVYAVPTTQVHGGRLASNFLWTGHQRKSKLHFVEEAQSGIFNLVTIYLAFDHLPKIVEKIKKKPVQPADQWVKLTAGKNGLILTNGRAIASPPATKNSAR